MSSRPGQEVTLGRADDLQPAVRTRGYPHPLHVTLMHCRSGHTSDQVSALARHNNLKQTVDLRTAPVHTARQIRFHLKRTRIPRPKGVTLTQSPPPGLSPGPLADCPLIRIQIIRRCGPLLASGGHCPSDGQLDLLSPRAGLGGDACGCRTRSSLWDTEGHGRHVTVM